MQITYSWTKPNNFWYKVTWNISKAKTPRIDMHVLQKLTIPDWANIENKNKYLSCKNEFPMLISSSSLVFIGAEIKMANETPTNACYKSQTQYLSRDNILAASAEIQMQTAIQAENICALHTIRFYWTNNQTNKQKNFSEEKTETFLCFICCFMLRGCFFLFL